MKVNGNFHDINLLGELSCSESEDILRLTSGYN